MTFIRLVIVEQSSPVVHPRYEAIRNFLAGVFAGLILLIVLVAGFATGQVEKQKTRTK